MGAMVRWSPTRPLTGWRIKSPPHLPCQVLPWRRGTDDPSPEGGFGSQGEDSSVSEGEGAGGTVTLGCAQRRGDATRTPQRGAMSVGARHGVPLRRAERRSAPAQRCWALQWRWRRHPQRSADLEVGTGRIRRLTESARRQGVLASSASPHAERRSAPELPHLRSYCAANDRCGPLVFREFCAAQCLPALIAALSS